MHVWDYMVYVNICDQDTVLKYSLVMIKWTESESKHYQSELIQEGNTVHKNELHENSYCSKFIYLMKKRTNNIYTIWNSACGNPSPPTHTHNICIHITKNNNTLNNQFNWKWDSKKLKQFFFNRNSIKSTLIKKPAICQLKKKKKKDYWSTKHCSVDPNKTLLPCVLLLCRHRASFLFLYSNMFLDFQKC